MTPFLFQLRPPRHPLLRFLLALAGLVLLGVFATLGAVIGGLVLLAWGLRRLWLNASGSASPNARTASRAAADPKVIEGEFSVVRKPQSGATMR